MQLNDELKSVDDPRNPSEKVRDWVPYPGYPKGNPQLLLRAMIETDERDLERVIRKVNMRRIELQYQTGVDIA